MQGSSPGFSLVKNTTVFNPLPCCFILLFPATKPGWCQLPAAFPGCSKHLLWQEGSRCAETWAAQCTLGTASICFCQGQAGGCCRAGLCRCPTTSRATHSWPRWPLNAPCGTGKGPFTDLPGGHSFVVISHPWFTSPAPSWNQHTAHFTLLSAKSADISAPQGQHLPFKVYLGMFMREEYLPQAFKMAGPCVCMDHAVSVIVSQEGMGKKLPRNVSGKANEIALYI